MIERAFVRTAAERATEDFGRSLADSLHAVPVTIGLSGDLGAGKTAFMRGFLRGMGYDGPVASPTHALEHRYATERCDVVHVDLYRLTEEDARRLLRESDDHTGVRCVEWPERAGDALQPGIAVRIEECGRDERAITIECRDVSWPDDETIEAWRRDLCLPPNVAAHCDTVARFCDLAADALLARGTFVRKSFLRAAGKTHDLLRFVDFNPLSAPPGHSDPPESLAVWRAWKAAHPSCATHEDAARVFLMEHGYPELANTVPEHSIHVAPADRKHTESRVLFYADKRVIGNRIVTVRERFDDFAVRYKKGERSPDSHRWERETFETERELFPDGPPE